MDSPKLQNDSTSQMFLTGTILLANLDYSGLMDYALKAVIGGIVWMGFKLGADFLSNKLRKK